MTKRFIDTWFWLTLIVETEPFHREANEFLLKWSYKGDPFFTSGSVIAETTSAVLHSQRFIKVPDKKLLPDYALKFVDRFKTAVAAGQLQVISAQANQIADALELLKANFRKIPKLSYFDCETVVLCKTEGINGVLTEDSDFQYLGSQIDPDWNAVLNP